MTTRSIAVLIAAASFSMVGCDQKAPQPPLAPPQQAPGPVAAPSSAPAAAPQTPAPHAAPAAAPGGALDQTVSTSGVSVTLPTGWKRNPPANQMRLAEAEVPGAGNDPAKSCLVVFSTAGGSVEENVTRWSGQVRDAAGQPVPAKSEVRTVGGLKVTVVEMSGSFAGMGDTAPKSNWTLRGAIIEGPQGLLFIKMTGPTDTMTAAAPAFGAMVDSVKKS